MNKYFDILQKPNTSKEEGTTKKYARRIIFFGSNLQYAAYSRNFHEIVKPLSKTGNFCFLSANFLLIILYNLLTYTLTINIHTTNYSYYIKIHELLIILFFNVYLLMSKVSHMLCICVQKIIQI